jgi:glutamate N-acetyltransferase/amino-acid N-acetyltransferase
VEVVQNGVKADFDEASVRQLLSSDPLEISVDLGVGRGRGLGLGCDLTEGYITENAAYSSS